LEQNPIEDAVMETNFRLWPERALGIAHSRHRVCEERTSARRPATLSRHRARFGC
jgi:hypothetical protein